MRLAISVIVLAIVGYGAWWVSINNDTVRELISNYLDTGEFLTLEARYTAEQIMESKRGELLADSEHVYLKPVLEFHPYLLFDVKYSRSDRKTAEGMILWGLIDGEMVLNTETWETTHGFKDCLHAKASHTDFVIINALARNAGGMDKESLSKSLHVNENTLSQWLDEAKDKHLVAQSGNFYRLHFENPRVQVTPQTKMTHWVVTKPYKHAQRLPGNFTRTQIRRISKAAFGDDFAIRSEKEVFLPVYNIAVKNPDGTILTSFWNALNGKRMTNLNNHY